MKERISTLMDGELDDRSAAQLIDTLGRSRESEALATWRTYHLIGDAMRDSQLLSEGFASRVSEKLAAEPSVLAPGRLQAEPRRWFALSAAASLAAVALVGWLAFAPQQAAGPLPVAKAPTAIPVAATKAPALAQVQKPAIVPLPSATNDYLLAHQGFSPRNSLQGMAPYVRTVSDSAREAGK